MSSLLAFAGSIESVAALLALLEKMKIDRDPHAHVRYWFRGQSRHGWSLTPKVYRTFPDDKKRLTSERLMNQDFRLMSAGLRTGDENDAEIYFLQQHYGMPTRLLDWTSSPLAALYFATTHDREHDNSDAQLFMIDANTLRKGGIATSRRREFSEALDGIANWRDEKHSDMILPIRPDHFDRRISLQRSGFTYHGPKKKVLDPVHSVKIPHTAKEKIRRQLSDAAIDHFSVFGDLDHLSRLLIEAYSRSTL
jgi:hypothetical protein